MGNLENSMGSLGDINEIAIFGFGKIGQGNIDIFIDFFQVKYIIDNNVKYQGKSYRDIRIIDFNNYIKLEEKYKIIVLSGKKTYESIALELQHHGLKEKVDFYEMNWFYQEWFWKQNKKLCLSRITASLTTYCTLNCKNCNMMTPYNKKKKIYDIELLKRDVDLLFYKVDYVSNFVIVGGEPLINKQLSQYIRHLGKYNNRIGNIQIITNGTILPSEELMEDFCQYNVEIRISDYSSVTGYDEKLEQLCKTLDDKKIKYTVFEQVEWLDFGFPKVKLNMGNTKEELQQHMMECNPMCHILHDGKLYFCALGWAAEESGLFKLRKGDYFDLDNTCNNKEQLYKFYFGDLEEGYMSFCKVCRGFGKRNTCIIPAAEQV